MMRQNDFAFVYKGISNKELLHVIENPHEYQASAVEAAKKELADRQLSDTDLNEAGELLTAEKQQKERQKEKVRIIEDKLRQFGHNMVETLNPVQSGIASAEKTVRLITIVFGGICIYHFIGDYKTHLAYIRDLPRFPFATILYFLPLILLPVAIVTFWKRTEFGWTLLMVYLTYSASDVLVAMVDSFTWRSSAAYNFFPRPAPATYVLPFAFAIGVMVVLCKATIRQQFGVSERRIAPTIGITVLVTSALILATVTVKE